MRRRQRKLITITVSVLALVGVATWVVLYIASAPERADKQFQEGMKLMMPGKYQDAVGHFNNALSMHKQFPEAYLERGEANRFLSDLDLALADYQAALDLNPNLADAHNGMALIYIERRDFPQALEHLNKSIALKPTVEAYYQRGELLESQGQHEKAIADYDRAIAEQRDEPYVYRARAVSKANMGDQEGARADRAIAEQIERH